jgi:DNA-binding NarL/FixJ family response regulator
VSRYASIAVSRQVRVLDLVCLGRSNKEIAAELGVTESDVKYHVSQLLRTNGVASRVELVVKILGGRDPVPAL